MLLRPKPKSNTQRQREFRKRNPGYYGRLHAKRRAAINASIEARLFAAEFVKKQFPRLPLMLPAPAVRIEIPGMNVIPTRLEQRAREAVPLQAWFAPPARQQREA